MKNAAINSGVFITIFIACYFFVTEVLSRILDIPKAPCYYEHNHAPKWIVKFYMDEGYHVEKSGNLVMLLLMILASALITLIFAFARNRSRHNSRNNR